MRHFPRSPAALFLILLFAAPPFAAPQQASQAGAVQEQAAVTVIEIPVNVIGKDGKPLAGLKAQDFTLYDDGKKVPISAVDVIDLSQPPPAAAPAAPSAVQVPAAARRLWLLVFDLTYTSPTGLLRARDGATNFVAKSMKENDLAAVGTLSLDTGWKLLVNFTRDRRQLSTAIETLGLPGAGVTRSPDPLGFAFSTPNPIGSPSEGGGGIVGSNADAMLENLRDLQPMQRQADDDFARGRVVKLLNSLAGIGRVLDSVRGRKHVLFFSEGFETRLLVGNAGGGGRSASMQKDQATASVDTSTTQGANEAAISGEIWKVKENARFGDSSLREALSNALGNFQRSDAVLDTVDIGGLRAENDAAGPKPGSGTDSLYTMASETDGDFVRNANQLGSELEKVSDRTSLVYLLAYQPKPLSRPGTFHKLKVDVKTSGAKVVSRSGYYEPRPYASLTPLEQLLASGDLVTGGSRSGGLQGRLLAAPFASRGEEAQVPIVLEIPGPALLAGDKGEKTTVLVYAYANDASGTLKDYITSAMELDLSKVRSALESGGIRYYGTLYLPPGDYGVRALVRDSATGRSSLASAAVHVPKMPGGSPTVLPPVFAAPQGSWLMVRGNPRSDAPQRTADYPFAVGGDSFIPTALPSVANGAETQVAVFTYNFGGAGKATPLEVRSQIVGSDGKARPVEMKTVKESNVERGGGRKLMLAFKPEGLAPGRYELRVAVSDPGSKAAGESASAFEVR